MNDPDAPGGQGFTHWIMSNMELVSVLPEEIPKAPSIKFPISAFQGRNNFGTTGYSGPCPPHGQTHRYDIKVYGLDTILDLIPGSDKDGLYQSHGRACCSIWGGISAIRSVMIAPRRPKVANTHSFQFYQLFFNTW